MFSAYRGQVAKLCQLGVPGIRRFKLSSRRQYRSVAAVAVDPYSQDLDHRKVTYRDYCDTLAAVFATALPSMEAPRKLQIVSDVHLEFYRHKTPPTVTRYGDDLALLGDIGKPFESAYRAFLEQQSDTFDNVFVLLGNHEFYNALGSQRHTVPEIVTKARAVCADIDRGNVHLLERNSFDLSGRTRLLGTTLWSDIDAITASQLNDFRMITSASGRRLTRNEYIDFHERDVAWLEQEIETCRKDGKQAIVLTHHGPCLGMAGKYEGSNKNPAFVTDLTRRLFTSPPVVAFASGHVHSNVDITVNGIRSVSNAVGYPGETTGYRKDVCIDVD